MSSSKWGKMASCHNLVKALQIFVKWEENSIALKRFIKSEIYNLPLQIATHHLPLVNYDSFQMCETDTCEHAYHRCARIDVHLWSVCVLWKIIGDNCTDCLWMCKTLELGDSSTLIVDDNSNEHWLSPLMSQDSYKYLLLLYKLGK